jgi:hypothetical protein
MKLSEWQRQENEEKKKRNIENGEIGEQIITEMFSDAIRSEDWFDSEKDGTINGNKYEVKTIRENEKTKGFWMDAKQWPKLDGVEVLFFNRIPEKLEDGIQVYRCEDHRNCWEYCQDRMGRTHRTYPLTSCTLLGTIHDERTKKVYYNSIANSKHKRFV